MRLLIREGPTAESARSVLQEIASNPRHEFWPGNASYHDIPVAGIIGHPAMASTTPDACRRTFSGRPADAQATGVGSAMSGLRLQLHCLNRCVTKHIALKPGW